MTMFSTYFCTFLVRKKMFFEVSFVLNTEIGLHLAPKITSYSDHFYRDSPLR